MPKRNDISKVLVIGSGPIIIGQAAEFDYSGTQACEAIKEEGFEVVLINSNPATIMTDKQTADKVYIEPITFESVLKVIEKERPDAIIGGMGGQTALNMTMELHNKGVLDKYGIKVIGTSVEGIMKGEDRDEFRKLMREIGQPIIESRIVNTLEDAKKAALEIGYPVVVRPAYTLGGTGGGIVNNEEELLKIAESGLSLSMTTQVLIEKSIKNWKEIEYEVMRDSNGTCITICNMENIDPVGIHTGDSIVVAPTQTLSDKECQMLRSAALDIIEAVGIEGGCNVQFALHPDSMEYAIIEINPRVSRSSALASKAVGYPIAKVSAKIALGYHLEEIKNAVTKETFACFEPSIDYVVIKVPKWPFDKFLSAKRDLGTKMMATGEVMSIGRTFEEAFLKAIRSLEIKKHTLVHDKVSDIPIKELRHKVFKADDERIFVLAQMLRLKYSVSQVSKITGIDLFFVNKINEIVKREEHLKTLTLETLTRDELLDLKKKGFSDKGISFLMGVREKDIYEMRQMWNINPVYKMVDTCAGEFEAYTPYYYSTYDTEDEVKVSDKKKVMVIGSGPIRIGQGIEFDYSSVHCVYALKQLGIETIVVNNNPETVSTDFDISNKLYFEPLTDEDVLNIYNKEKPDGVILQFGGQTAIKLAEMCVRENIPILGTSPDSIDRAEDRERFEEMLTKLGVKQPTGKGVFTVEEGIETANKIEYPVLVRPSYVLGGRGMMICHDEESLVKYLTNAIKEDPKNPVLIDKYLYGLELEVDAVCDGEDVFVPGIMEHLDRAGVHSGDSVTIYPTIHVSDKIKETLYDYTRKIALELDVRGMINIQFIVFKDELYVIEVNPRSSRTVPYITKITNVPILEMAVRSMFGPCIKEMGYGSYVYKDSENYGIKVPVFSTEKLPNVEVSLGPEMRSTGEVLGVSKNYLEALYKGFLAAGFDLSRRKRKLLISLNDESKEELIESLKKMSDIGYEFFATGNTKKYMEEHGVENVTEVYKIGYEGEHKELGILDVIKNHKIDLIINTPQSSSDSETDGFKIRRCAVECGVSIVTSIDSAIALATLFCEDLDYDKFDITDVASY